MGRKTAWPAGDNLQARISFAFYCWIQTVVGEGFMFRRRRTTLRAKATVTMQDVRRGIDRLKGRGS